MHVPHLSILLPVAILFLHSACKTTTSSSTPTALYDSQHFLSLVPHAYAAGTYEFQVCLYDGGVVAPSQTQCVSAFRTSQHLHPLFRFQPLPLSPSQQQELLATERLFKEQTDRGLQDPMTSFMYGLVVGTGITASALTPAILQKKFMLKESLDPQTGKPLSISLQHAQHTKAPTQPSSTIQDLIQLHQRQGDAGLGNLIQRTTTSIAHNTDLIMRSTEPYGQSLHHALLEWLQIPQNQDTATRLAQVLQEDPQQGLRALESAQEQAAKSLHYSDTMSDVVLTTRNMHIDHEEGLKHMFVFLKQRLLSFKRTIAQDLATDKPLTQMQMRMLYEWQHFITSRKATAETLLGLRGNVLANEVLARTYQDLQALINKVQKTYPHQASAAAHHVWPSSTLTAAVQRLKQALTARRQHILLAELAPHAVKTARAAAKLRRGPGKWKGLGIIITAIVGGSVTVGHLTGTGLSSTSHLPSPSPPPSSASSSSAALSPEKILIEVVHSLPPSSKASSTSTQDQDPSASPTKKLNMVHLLSPHWTLLDSTSSPQPYHVASVAEVLEVLVQEFDPASGNSTARGAGLITDYCLPQSHPGPNQSITPHCTTILSLP